MIDGAYLSGVVASDGWCRNFNLGLRAKDFDFVKAFCDSLNREYSLELCPKLDERGYWVVRVSNKAGRYNYLSTYVPRSDKECASWIKGFFDGDGNAQLTPQPQISENAFARRVAMYNSDEQLLKDAARYLEQLEISTVLRPIKNSIGHRGKKQMYQLRLRHSHVNFQRFFELVGSSIERKRKTLKAIPESYSLDRAAYCRKGQRRGAKAKRRKTMEITLPKVVRGIRELIDQGVKPTQQNCGRIPKYGSIQRYFRQADLVAMAREEKS